MKRLTILLALSILLALFIGCDMAVMGSGEYIEPPADLPKDVNRPADTSSGLSRVSVHDPSIEYDPATKKYWIFGSHGAVAHTTDLINWKYCGTEAAWQQYFAYVFQKNISWAERGSEGYSIHGNLWAPDVIYNEDMKKWCIYMSINGNNHYSVIAMATADNIDGPYTYAGPIVYSGFRTADELSATDYKKATGSTTLPSYSSNWRIYGTNAIDPCVLYDKNGDLWMIYGSWFGGLYVIKLDKKTGLRDYSYTYQLDSDASDGVASDPYLGLRVSGGFGGTGEGPFIVYDEEDDYYYLYVSYDGLNATDKFSGYHMRLFRSKEITGPYVDAAGNYAARTSASDAQNVKGIKIMGNYYLSSLANAPSSSNATNGYMSPGHNSAIIADGNHYVIYHTRFNIGKEWHAVRIHQQFKNEDGWLCTAPYENRGSTISKTGYKTSEIKGTYDLVNHGNHSNPDKALVPMLPLYKVVLKEDGTITGDYTGTWEAKSGTYYVTMEIDSVTYKGVFFKQKDESKNTVETMTFSVIGENNLALWGSKISSSTADKEAQIAQDYKVTAVNNSNILTDGYSISFWAENYSSDWDMLITTSVGNIAMPCLHYLENNVWKANKWQCDAANNAGLSYNNMLNAGTSAKETGIMFITINIKADSIEYYRDGVLAYYHNDDTNKDAAFPTIGTYCTNILNEINTNGYTLRPSDTWASQNTSTIVCTGLKTDKALSAEEAAALYNSVK